MERWLNRILSLLFGLMLTAVLFTSFRQWEYNSLAAVAAGVVLVLVLGAAVHFISPFADALTPWRFRAFLAVGLALYAVLLTLAGTALSQVLLMDMAYVYNSLPDFLNGFPLEESNFYYIICNNNLGLALLLAGFYNLMPVPPTGSWGLEAGILFNCLMIWLTILLICRCCRLLTHSNSAVFAVFLLSALFAPFLLWTPCFYSDTLSMPFLMLTILCFLRFRLASKRGILWLLGSAICAFLGYAVKGSVAVVVVAIAMWLVWEHLDGLRSALRQAGVYLLCFALLLGGYKALQHMVLLDYTDSEEYALPTELWLCYGSHDDGNYSQEDYEYCSSLPNLATRRTAMRQRIAENYGSYSPRELWNFETRKAALTWADGTYNAAEYLAAPQQANWTAFFTIHGQPGFMPLTYYCQAFQYMLLALTALGAFVNLAHPWPSGRSFLQLNLFGAILFLSLWETKARYALNFSPLLILASACILWQAVCPAESGGLFASFEDS